MKKYIITKPKDFVAFCTKLKPIISFDCETTSLKWLELEIIGFSICDGKQACYVVITPEYKEELLDILAFYLKEAKMVVMHNASYDLMVLKKEGIEI